MKAKLMKMIVGVVVLLATILIHSVAMAEELLGQDAGLAGSGWRVYSSDGAETNTYAKLSEALANLADGGTLQAYPAGDWKTFNRDNLNPVDVDCALLVTNNDVTVDFNGRVIMDAKCAPLTPLKHRAHPYLVAVSGARGVTVKNGYLFGCTYDPTSSEVKKSHRRLVLADHGATVALDNCAMFGPGVSDLIGVFDGSQMVIRNGNIDGLGDGVGDIVVIRDGSTLELESVRGFWNPKNFWGTEDGVVDSLPCITGEQFVLDGNSKLVLTDTSISNTVTHWTTLAASAVDVTGEGNRLVLDGKSAIMYCVENQPAITVEGELAISGDGWIQGDEVKGEGVSFEGGHYQFDPTDRVSDNYVVTQGGGWWRVSAGSFWRVYSSDGSEANTYAKLSEALANLADGGTLQAYPAGDPAAFTRDNLNPVDVDCPFIVTNDNVTVDFNGRAITNTAYAPGRPAFLQGRPHLVVVSGARGVTVKDGYLLARIYNPDSMEPRLTDCRAVAAVYGAEVRFVNCVIIGPAVSKMLYVDGGSRMTLDGCCFDGQGDGEDEIVSVNNGSTLVLNGVKGFWNPNNFWGAKTTATYILPCITGEQYVLNGNSTLELWNTSISNAVTVWSADIPSSIVARGDGNRLVLDGKSAVKYCIENLPAIAAEGELVISGDGWIQGDEVKGDGVSFEGGNYQFDPSDRVADNHVVTKDGDWWRVGAGSSWKVFSSDGSETGTYAKLSEALANLTDGSTLQVFPAGDPAAFNRYNLNPVDIDCAFVITNDDVTVDFNGRAIMDAKSGPKTPAEHLAHPYLVVVSRAKGVTVKNGYLFGLDYDTTTTGIKESHRRLVASLYGAQVTFDKCAMFGPGISEMIGVFGGSQMVIRNSCIDGHGDGASDIVVIRDGSTLELESVKGFWNPGDFWGTQSDVVDTLPCITGEQFVLDGNSKLVLTDTSISNAVTHWVSSLDVSAVKVSGEGNEIELNADSMIWIGYGDIPVISCSGTLLVSGQGLLHGPVTGEGAVIACNFNGIDPVVMSLSEPLSVFSYAGVYDGEIHAASSEQIAADYASLMPSAIVEYRELSDTSWKSTSPSASNVSDSVVFAYRVSASGYGSVVHACNVTLSKRYVELRSLSKTFVYDGSAHSCEEVAISGDGFLEGDGVSFSNFSSITKVGSVANDFSYTFIPAEGRDSKNYTLSQEKGMLEVVNSDEYKVVMVRTEWPEGVDHSRVELDCDILTNGTTYMSAKLSVTNSWKLDLRLSKMYDYQLVVHDSEIARAEVATHGIKYFSQVYMSGRVVTHQGYRSLAGMIAAVRNSTIILTENGWKEVRDVQKGEFVATDRQDVGALFNLVCAVDPDSADVLDGKMTKVTPFVPVAVPYSWLDRNTTVVGGDYDRAAASFGKNWYPLWKSYVIGLDPKNPFSRFVVSIKFGYNGKPIIRWSPDLSDAVPRRIYTIYGKKSLWDSEWTKVDDQNIGEFRFFHVQVGLE